MENDNGLPSLEALHALIQVQSERVLHYFMLQDKLNYLKEIDDLAETCTNLLVHHIEGVEQVVHRMETSMTSSYLQSLKDVQQEITSCMEKRNKVAANSFYGGKESDALTKRITTLEQSKNISPPSLMEKIVSEVFAQVTNKSEAIIEQHFPPISGAAKSF